MVSTMIQIVLDWSVDIATKTGMVKIDRGYKASIRIDNFVILELAILLCIDIPYQYKVVLISSLIRQTMLMHFDVVASLT